MPGRQKSEGDDEVRKRDDMVGAQISQFELFDSNCSILVVRACPLIEITQTVPCRAIRGRSIAVSSTLPPSSSCQEELRMADETADQVQDRESTEVGESTRVSF